MIKTILAATAALCTLTAAALPTQAASADPIPAGCFQHAVLDSTACANYSYTGDPRYANYGYRCGHDIDANAEQCHDSFHRAVPSSP
jgi:hypothetical protein